MRIITLIRANSFAITMAVLIIAVFAVWANFIVGVYSDVAAALGTI
jgi:hypothetical protein